MTSRFAQLLSLSLLLALQMPSSATICTWTGGTGDWSEGAKWTNGVPGDGDTAILNAGQVNLTSSSSNLAAFTMTGGKVTFSNAVTRLIASTVILQGGTLTHVTNSATTTNQFGEWPVYGTVWIACDTFTLQTNAWIDVLSRGFQGGVGNGVSGYGPGRGTAASHGGLGAALPGPLYDTPDAPVKPGSGGAGSSWGNGGAGGGAVRIDATGVVTLDGTIRASAQQGGGDRQGGGSGGSVWITCQRVEGNGEVAADGGWVPPNLTYGGGYGGGGGRIAVQYDTAAQAAIPIPRVRFSVAPGTLPVEGEPGTLFFPDNRLLYGDVVPHRGVWSVSSVTSGVAALGFDHLTISNGWLQFLNETFTLTVTNDLLIFGDNKVNSGIRFFDAGRLEFSNGKLAVGGSATLANAGSLFLNRGVSNRIAGGGAAVNGDLRLLTNCQMIVEGHVTNGTADFGQSVSVTGLIEIGSNSWIFPVSHPTNGGSVVFAANRIWVHPTGGFNADNRGYRGALIGYSADNWGPGRGLYSSGGGSYGGKGGFQSYNTYGSLTNPAECGSSGGAQAGLGGNGGGLVRIESAGAVTLNGTISANGNDGGLQNSDRRSGGGSGGGVFISCSTFAGTNGLIRVNGGLGRNGTYASGGGGGGRIAVLYDPSQQDAIPLPGVVFSAQGGRSATVGYMNNDTMDGSPGTLYFPDSRFLTEPILHSGVWLAEGPVTNWSVNACLLSNVWIRFPQEGFALTVTQDLRLTHAARLDLSGGVVRVGGNLILTNRATLTLHAPPTLPPALNVAGNAQFDQNSFLNVYGATSNSIGLYGATVDVAGAVTLNAGCWVWPFSNPTNGGSALFRFGSDLMIASNAGFNAATFGCLGGINNGRGWGIGGGGSAGGGGYGGTGGVYGVNSSGRAYGSSNSPSDAGSGGGSGNNLQAGAGGGLIRLEVRHNVTLNGTLNANGQDSIGSYAAGGSGGGIYLSCRKLSGAGSLQAKGGGGGTHANGGGGGGGGRIAVRRVMDVSPQSIVRDVSKGTAVQPTRLGDNGTVVMGFLHDPRGAVIVVR
jgi:hypothetical protein